MLPPAFREGMLCIQEMMDSLFSTLHSDIASAARAEQTVCIKHGTALRTSFISRCSPCSALRAELLRRVQHIPAFRTFLQNSLIIINIINAACRRAAFVAEQTAVVKFGSAFSACFTHVESPLFTLSQSAALKKLFYAVGEVDKSPPLPAVRQFR